MKKIKSIFLLFCLSFTFGCNFNHNNNNISITVKSTAEGYNFEAYYPERKTTKVQDYVKSTLKEDKLFANGDGNKNSEIKLGDTIKFHLSSTPGYIAIDFKKEDNSYPNYKKLEKLCIGIKAQLK